MSLREMATLRCPKCGDTRVDIKHKKHVVEIYEDGVCTRTFDPSDDPAVYLSCAAPLCYTTWIILEHWREKP